MVNTTGNNFLKLEKFLFFSFFFWANSSFVLTLDVLLISSYHMGAISRDSQAWGYVKPFHCLKNPRRPLTPDKFPCKGRVREESRSQKLSSRFFISPQIESWNVPLPRYLVSMGQHGRSALLRAILSMPLAQLPSAHRATGATEMGLRANSAKEPMSAQGTGESGLHSPQKHPVSNQKCNSNAGLCHQTQCFWLSRTWRSTLPGCPIRKHRRADRRCYRSLCSAAQPFFPLFYCNKWNTEIGETQNKVNWKRQSWTPAQRMGRADGSDGVTVLCSASLVVNHIHPQWEVTWAQGWAQHCSREEEGRKYGCVMEQHRQFSCVLLSKKGPIKKTHLPLQLYQTFYKKSLRGHCFCPVFQYIKCNYFIVDLPVIRGMCLNMIYWVSFVPVDLQ